MSRDWLRVQVFMKTAFAFAELSTCQRGQVGCVIVKDGRIVSTGYNGTPTGMPHCRCKGSDECTDAIHAESNALAYAARYGVSVDGATVYCTHGACLKCAQLMVAAGIVRVVYASSYRVPDGVNLLKQASVNVGHFSQPGSRS